MWTRRTRRGRPPPRPISLKAENLSLKSEVNFFVDFFRERRPFPPHESAQQGHALVEAKAAKAVGEAKVEH